MSTMQLDTDRDAVDQYDGDEVEPVRRVGAASVLVRDTDGRQLLVYPWEVVDGE